MDAGDREAIRHPALAPNTPSRRKPVSEVNTPAASVAVSEATPAAPRVRWLNVLFLMSSLIVALAGTPWYLATRGLGWPEALTFAGLWLAVGLSVTGGYHPLFPPKPYPAPLPR